MILFSRQPGHVWRQLQQFQVRNVDDPLSTYDDGMKVIQAIKTDDINGAEDLIQSGCRLDGRDVRILVFCLFTLLTLIQDIQTICLGWKHCFDVCMP